MPQPAQPLPPIDPEQVNQVATMLTATSAARATYFKSPGDVPLPPFVGGNVVHEQRAHFRSLFSEAVYAEIAARVADNRVTSTVNSDTIWEHSLKPIVEKSERSLSRVLFLSGILFAVGVGLIVFAGYVAVGEHVPGEINRNLISALTGTTGALSSLGAVFTLARQAIREATLDHVRLRVVLTALATQLGQLRGAAEGPLTTGSDRNWNLATISGINADLSQAMRLAIELIDPRGGTTAGADDRPVETTAEAIDRPSQPSARMRVSRWVRERLEV